MYPEDISCFLLIRSLIEKELNIKIYNKNTKAVLDMNCIALNKKQTQRIITKFLGDENPQIVQRILSKFIYEHRSVRESFIISHLAAIWSISMIL